MTDYRLDVYDTAGTQQAQLTDFTSLSYTKRVNSPGIINFTLRGDHNLLSSIDDKWQIDVMRLPDGQTTWVREIAGFYRYLTWEQDEASVATLLCQGIMSMLDWRVVAWYANTANRTKFNNVKAETICNTLVKYNATSFASVANGRIREGAIPGLTVEADGAEGDLLDWYCAYENLLKTMQDIADIGGGDFDVVKTAPATYQFRWYTGQLGTDRTADIVFSLERGNMAKPVYEDNRTQEATVALVGGKGEELNREVVVMTGTNYNVTLNNVEMFVNATDIGATIGLQYRGASELAGKEALKTFTFDIIQIETCKYGINYFLGDRVTAINPYLGDDYTVKLDAVTVNLADDGTEEISVEIGEIL